MAGSGMANKVVCLVLLCMIVWAPNMVNAQVSCSTVISDLFPCLSYVQNGGTTVPDACCNGIRALYSAASTTADRQSVCGCLKQGAGMVTGISLDFAASLPSKCGVNIPYKISPSTDCTKVQ